MPITRKDLLSLFSSPLAWSLLGLIQLILAWWFLVHLDEYIQLQDDFSQLQTAPGMGELIVAPLMDAALSLVMLFVPVLTMRSLAEEFRSNTMSLLMSSPISMVSIVWQKYLALVIMMGVIVLMIALMPLSLLLGGQLNWGQFLAACLALWLSLSTFSAMGLYFSSLTHQPAVAAAMTYGLLLFMWVLSLANASNAKDSEVFLWISPMSHFKNLLNGWVSSADLAYFLLLIGVFLGLTIMRLEILRVRQ